MVLRFTGAAGKRMAVALRLPPFSDH